MTGPVLGRRAGAPDTRAEILDAAREMFSAKGYDRATIRGIAGQAGVDPSLVHHYFGTKDELFAASIDLPIPPVETLKAVFTGDQEEIGRKLAETFFRVWEDEQARAALLGILRSATSGEDQAVEAFRQFLTNALLEQIHRVVGADDARLRALLMASQLVGVALTRYVMRLEPIASAPVDDIIDLVAPRIQSYL